MELRAYWKIIWRRIWLVALVVGVVALYVGYQYYHLRKTPGALTAYRSDVTIQIGLQSSPSGVSDNVGASDSLADALVTGPILSSKEFDTAVSQQIAADMPQIEQRYGHNPNLGAWQNAGAIGGALSTERAHSLVTISATWTTPVGAWAIADAVGRVSTASICNYLGYVVAKDTPCSTTTGSIQPVVSARIISEATDAATVAGSSVNKQTILIVLLLMALIVGIALAFLADYLDDRIHGKDDAQQLLRLPVYGEVPRAPTVGRTSS